jgi:hypothetical protein
MTPSPRGSSQSLSKLHTSESIKRTVYKQVFLNKELAYHPNNSEDTFNSTYSSTQFGLVTDKSAASTARALLNHSYIKPLLATYNRLLKTHKGCAIVALSCERMAHDTKYCRKTIVRCIKILKWLGLIDWVASHKKPNVYRFNNALLRNKEFQRLVSPHVPSLSFFGSKPRSFKISASQFHIRMNNHKEKSFNEESSRSFQPSPSLQSPCPTNNIYIESSSKVSSSSLYKSHTSFSRRSPSALMTSGELTTRPVPMSSIERQDLDAKPSFSSFHQDLPSGRTSDDNHSRGSDLMDEILTKSLPGSDLARITTSKTSSTSSDFMRITTSNLYREGKNPNGNRTSSYLSLIKPIHTVVADLEGGQPTTIYAREGNLSKVLARVGLLLGLEGRERDQFAHYSDETLLHAENKLAKCETVIIDRVKWFHAVCKDYNKRSAPNFNGDERSYGKQYNRKGYTRKSSYEPNLDSIGEDLPNAYKITRMCSADTPGAIYNPITKTYYHEVEVQKKDPNRQIEQPAYESLKAAFDRDTREQTPYFKSLRDLILARAARGEKLDASVFADEPRKAPARQPQEERIRTPEEIQARLEGMFAIMRESFKQKIDN